MTRKWQRSLDGWWSEVYDAATPAELFGAFGGLVSTWQAKAGDDAVPAWNAFDIRDFHGWYGRLMMAEWPSGTIRLFGGELIDMFGRDFTRGRLEDAFRGMTGFVKSHIAAVASDRGIGFCDIDFTFAGKDDKRAVVVTLPLVSGVTGTELYLAAFEPGGVFPGPKSVS